MNISHQDLQTLVQFSNLLTLLSTPDKIQTAIFDAKKVLADEQALLGPAATVEGANAYKAKVEKDAEELMKSLTNDRHEFVALKEGYKKAVEKRQQELSDREAKVNAKETLMGDWETDLKKRTTVIEADEKKSYQIAERLEQRAKSLVEQEAALAAKQEQLKKILS